MSCFQHWNCKVNGYRLYRTEILNNGELKTNFRQPKRNYVLNVTLLFFGCEPKKWNNSMELRSYNAGFTHDRTASGLNDSMIFCSHGWASASTEAWSSWVSCFRWLVPGLLIDKGPAVLCLILERTRLRDDWVRWAVLQNDVKDCFNTESVAGMKYQQ